MLTILNPAPASKFQKNFLIILIILHQMKQKQNFIQELKSNEKEAKEASIKLLNLGLKSNYYTWRKRFILFRWKEEIYLKASQLKQLDTTGAGDAFNGG